MRRISVSLLAALTVIVCVCACGDKRFKGYEKSETGMYFKFKERNPEGKIPQMGDFLYLTVSYYSDNDSIQKLETREMVGVLDEPLFKGDIYEAYAMLKQGEEAEFVIKADSFFFYYMGGNMGRPIPSYITEKDVLFFTIKMDNIKTIDDFAREEEEAIADYITENEITVKPLPSGLYYIETEKGKGKKVEQNSKVSVHYTGKFLDGTLFDSSIQRGEPITFTVGLDPMIQGFTEGVTYMNKGGKAIFILPSDIAYGDGGGRFPPFKTLMFEVEIIEVE